MGMTRAELLKFGSRLPTSWLEVLEELENNSIACRSALENGLRLPLQPLIPSGLGPLPPALYDRAVALIANIRSLEDRCTEIRNSIATLIELVESPPPPPPPIFFDKSS